jgi:hypothetical protein
VIEQSTAALVADVERAIVDFIPPSQDRDIHRLGKNLRAALAGSDQRALRRLAQDIVDHAAHRYAPVGEQADRPLCRLNDAR